METLLIIFITIVIFCIFIGICMLIAYIQVKRAQSEEVQRTYLVFYKGDNGPEKIKVEAYDFQDAIEVSLVDEKDVTSVHIYVPKYPDVQGSPVKY